MNDQMIQPLMSLINAFALLFAGAYTSAVAIYIQVNPGAQEYWIEIILGSGGVAALLLYALKYMRNREKKLEKELAILRDKMNEDKDQRLSEQAKVISELRNKLGN